MFLNAENDSLFTKRSDWGRKSKLNKNKVGYSRTLRHQFFNSFIDFLKSWFVSWNWWSLQIYPSNKECNSSKDGRHHLKDKQQSDKSDKTQSFRYRSRKILNAIFYDTKTFCSYLTFTFTKQASISRRSGLWKGLR